MTCTSAIVLGDTRKAWVDDACGNTWSGKCATSNGCATRQKHGGLAHYAQSQQTQIDIPKTNHKHKVDNMTGLAQLRASATARASAI